MATAKKRRRPVGRTLTKERGTTSFTLNNVRVVDNALAMTMDVATARPVKVDGLGEISARVAIAMPGAVIVEVSQGKNWRAFQLDTEELMRVAIEKVQETAGIPDRMS